MPHTSSSSSSAARRSSRGRREAGVRRFAFWFIETGYFLGMLFLVLAAAGIAIYAFTVNFGEGVRAIVFFVIPAMWGAYVLAIYDGHPQVIEQLADKVATYIAAAAALVVGCTFIFKAPVSIANLALGVMSAFFFLLWTSNQSSPWRREFTREETILTRLFLVVVTILAAFAAAAL